jgi:hypothetical protein
MRGCAAFGAKGRYHGAMRWNRCRILGIGRRFVALEPEEASISVILINVFRQPIVAWHPRCGTRLTVFSANMSSRPSFVLLAQLPPLSPRVCIEVVALYRVDCKVKGRLALSKKAFKMA